MAVTTGGTYKNPELGIQDYTAFGRGLASTFKLPEIEKEEEKEEQDISIDIPEVEGGTDWYGGVDLDRTAEVKLNQNFAEDLGLRLKNDLENSKEGSEQYNKNLNRLDLINDAIGIDSNLAYISNLIGDGKNVDYLASNLKLPGINPREESDYTIPQMYKRIHEGKMTPHISIFEGIEYGGLKDIETGQFINLSAADKAYVNKRIKERYDITLSVLANDSYAKPYKNFTALKNEETVYKDKDGVEFKVTSGKKYYSDDQINYFDTAATNFATDQARISTTDDTFDSLYLQVKNKVEKGKFALKDDTDVNNKVAVVKDFLAEQYKLTHGSDYYSLDKETGRAMARTQSNAFLFEEGSVEQKPGKGEEALISAEGIDDFYKKFTGESYLANVSSLMENRTYGGQKIVDIELPPKISFLTGKDRIITLKLQEGRSKDEVFTRRIPVNISNKTEFKKLLQLTDGLGQGENNIPAIMAEYDNYIK
jgi:hypothetical protein